MYKDWQKKPSNTVPQLVAVFNAHPQHHLFGSCPYRKVLFCFVECFCPAKWREATVRHKQIQKIRYILHTYRLLIISLAPLLSVLTLRSVIQPMPVHAERWICKTSLCFAYWFQEQMLFSGLRPQVSRSSCPADHFYLCVLLTWFSFYAFESARRGC